jgi:transposase
MCGREYQKEVQWILPYSPALLTAQGYQTIMEDYLLPFVGRVFPNGHRLVIGNDPKQISTSTGDRIKANKINHWPAPPESPDLNNKERIWAAMKYHIRRRVKPTNKKELVKGTRDV